MAPDPVPTPGPAPSRATLDHLHRALLSFARREEADGALRAALGRLSAEARERGVPPEAVLVHLKQEWNSLPLADSHSGPNDRAAALQRVVTMCIKEYFR